MKMELTAKNKAGIVTAHRGKRRVMVDGELKNETVSLKTGEWADRATLVEEAKINAELVSIMTEK